MKLVLCEKPSVGKSIAGVIGASGHREGYLEGNGYLVSWCIGHLVGLAPADRYDQRYLKWVKEDLPILPEPWQFVVFPDTKEQFQIVKGLMERPDVEEIIEATDAGREGGTDLPPGIPDGRMPETFSKALDLFHGGKCSPGRFQEPASRCGV